MTAYNTINDTSRYVPEDHGCRCSECILYPVRRQNKYVPPEIRQGAELLVIAEAPGHTEEELRRPLVGSSGREHSRALLKAGSSRERTSLTNALLCRPPGNDLKKLMAGWSKRNKRRKAKGEEPLPSPIACCSAHLFEEIKGHDNLLLLGATARQVLLESKEGSEKSMMASRGFPDRKVIDGREYNLLSSVHPAFVLRSRRWTTIYEGDLDKAVRMARGRLQWRDPDMVFNPTVDQLRDILARLRSPITYDVETRPKSPDHPFDPTTDVLRCIGISDKDLATCVHFESVVDRKKPFGMSAFYSPEDQARVRALLREFFGAPDQAIMAHNVQYDALVMRHQCPDIPVLRREFDTVISHHVIWSELPHNLGFVMAQYTDSPQHKNVDHDKWASDEDIAKYCMLDCAGTSRVGDLMVKDVRLWGQKRAFEADMRLSRFCRELHEVGMWLDVPEMKRHYKVFTERMDEARVAAQAMAVQALPSDASKGARKLAEGLNPNSPQQVGAFMFEVCGVAPVPGKEGGYTDTGEPSVSKDNLLYLVDKGLTPQLEETVQLIIDYREASKLRGYCSIVPMEDGRVRPNWNPHVVVSGRLSCSDPNVMNVKGDLRSMWAAPPGHILVFCDKKQLELRIIAWLAQDWELIRVFQEDKFDVHTFNASKLLEMPIERVNKGARKFTKAFVYAVQYGAALNTAFRMIRNHRDEFGQRPYRDRTIGQIETLYKRFWRQRNAIKVYQKANQDLWAEQGYLEEPLHNRRRYFLDGGGDESVKEAQNNFPVQSLGAADVNDATERVIAEFPWGFAGESTGVIHYNYDSLGLEVPEDMGWTVGRRVQELMASHLEGMPLPTDLGVGPNWRDLDEAA